MARKDYLNCVINKNNNNQHNNNQNNYQENNQKISEDVRSIPTNKLILKPIEIKDTRKNKINNDLKNINYNQNNNLNSKNQNYPKNKINNQTIIKNKSISNNITNYNHNSISSKNLLSKEYSDNNYNNFNNYNEILKKERLKEAQNFNNTKNLNSTTLDLNNQSPVQEKKIFDQFSKTSNFEFNLIENLDFINLNTDISLIEENLKLKKGEIMKKLKSIYDNFNISQNIFKNTKSNYQNTSMIDRERNPNITRIETIFENYNENYYIKSEELISLNTYKSTRKIGNLKKMLHIGSLNIYAVRVYKN